MTAALACIPARFARPPVDESTVILFAWTVLTGALAAWSRTDPGVIPMVLVATAFLFEFGHLQSR